MRRYLDSWEQYSFELEDIAEVSPGKVVGICRESGVDSTGTPVDRRFGGLWVVEDGKIVLLVHLPDPTRGGQGGEGRNADAKERPRPAATQHKKLTPEDKARAAKARAKLKRQRQAAG